MQAANADIGVLQYNTLLHRPTGGALAEPDLPLDRGLPAMKRLVQSYDPAARLRLVP